MKDLFKQYNKKDLKDLFRYGILRVEEIENPSVYNGKLGMTIIFYEYSRYSGDMLYEEFADDILDSVLELSSDLPFYFSNGLIGICWGITYLLREKFIDGNIDNILFELDEKLSKIDTSNKKILKDYMCYLIIRKNITRKKLHNYLYDEKKILENIWNSCLIKKM